MLVLHYDVTSPSSAVALLRLQPLADAGGRVGFNGFDALGLEISVPPTLPLLEELRHESERAGELGLPMRRPTRQPPTLRFHLLGELAAAYELGAAWRMAGLRAYWSEDLDVDDRGVLIDLAVAIGLDRDTVEGRLDDRRELLELRNRMTAQRRRGLGGVPVLEADGTFVPADLSEADLRQLAHL